MGLNFNRPDAPTQTAPAAQAELEQVKSYDIVVDRKQMSAYRQHDRGQQSGDDRIVWGRGRRRDLQSIGCGVKQHGYETAG